jgi:hypothetical protein
LPAEPHGLETWREAEPLRARLAALHNGTERVAQFTAPTHDQDDAMIYLLAAFLPPLGLLLNGQPLAALLNLILIVPCVIFGLVFHVLLLVPSLLAIISIYHKRGERRHREIVDAIERHGPPPGYGR